MFGTRESYWYATGEKRMENFMREQGIPEDKIRAVISEMDDVIDEVRSQARDDGAAEESYSNSMMYMG